MAKDKRGKSEGKKAKIAEKKQKQEKKGAKKEKTKASKADDSDAEDVDLDAVLAEYAKKQVSPTSRNNTPIVWRVLNIPKLLGQSILVFSVLGFGILTQRSRV